MALYDMYELVVFTGLALSALVGVDQIFVRKAASKDSVVSTVTNPEFLRFQNTYCIVYFLAVFADWLQGPYVYKLYSYYGFGEFEIAVLYIIGFAVSATLGTFTGPLADKFGRKRMCLIFCVLYGLTCLTKVSSSGIVLGLGRVLGGISTSILFSAFESWYVYEHKERYQFDSSWLSLTFGRTTYWNGILAIFAGVVANVVAEDLEFGPLAPFIVAIPVLMACAVAIQTGWHENYGQSTFSFRTSCMEGLYKILDSRLIFLVGCLQSLFESVMYIFVFLWTPILQPQAPPLGFVFASFMLCIMLGSSVFSLLSARGQSAINILGMAFALAFSAMGVLTFTASFADLASVTTSFFAFLTLELGVGMYFPSIGCLRSMVVPESHRAGIMNWFRVPMNTITVAALLWIHNNPPKSLLCLMCVALLSLGAYCVYWFKEELKNSSVASPRSASPTGATTSNEKSISQDSSLSV